jgi:hypothetical protein
MRRIISAVKRGNRLRLLALSMLVVAVLVGTTGCYSKLNGGGWMQSANGESRATFGIHYDADLRAARGIYQDKAAGVRIKLTDFVVADFGTPTPDECAYYTASYQSLDKTERYNENGQIYFANIEACDNGEPGFRGDTLGIELLFGPDDGYSNSGPILGGNLQGLKQTE